MTLAASALALASAGFRVVPLHGILADGSCSCSLGDACGKSSGKHPRIADWPALATSDPSVVEGWWRAWPEANVGLAMGGPGRFVAIDVDGPEGRASLAALEAAHGALPPTLAQSSGRKGGGEHRIFTVPPHLAIDRIGNKVKFAPGLDVRAEGGQIVAAPSVHLSGRRYEWTSWIAPAPMPDWLYAEITNAPAKSPYTAPVGAVAGDRIAEGGRNSYLTSLAGTLRSRGASHDAILAAIQAENASRLDPPLPESEVATIAASVARYDTANDPALASAIVSAAQAHAPRPAQMVYSGRALICDKKGIPKPLTANVVTILANDPAWEGVLGFNARSLEALFLRCPPWGQDVARADDAFPRPISEADASAICTWFGEAHRMEVSARMVFDGLVSVASWHPFDPVVDFLDGLPPWDEENRIATWLKDYAGAHDAPDLYLEALSTRWLVQAVARAIQPGCQADCVLILEGITGRGKSSLLRTLFGEEFFGDDLPPIDNVKDAKQYCHGPWGIENQELAATRKADVEATKQFMTLRADRFRPPYGRNTASFRRGCVFAATTNEKSYLKDHTGNRRFLPVKTGRIDLAGLAAVRLQLWAEALEMYNNPDRPERWWFTADETALAEVEQEARYEGDALEEVILHALDVGVRAQWGATPGVSGSEWVIAPKAESVSVADIVLHVLKETRIDRASQMRVSRILAKAGWERRQVRDGTLRPWRYFRP